MTHRGIAKFQGSFIQIMEQHLRGTSNVAGEVEKLDETLSQKVDTSPNMEAEVEELRDALDSACRPSFRPTRSTKKALPHKSVPWWTKTYNIDEKGKRTASEVSTHDRE